MLIRAHSLLFLRVPVTASASFGYSHEEGLQRQTFLLFCFLSLKSKNQGKFIACKHSGNICFPLLLLLGSPFPMTSRHQAPLSKALLKGRCYRAPAETDTLTSNRNLPRNGCGLWQEKTKNFPKMSLSPFCHKLRGANGHAEFSKVFSSNWVLSCKSALWGNCRKIYSS